MVPLMNLIEIKKVHSTLIVQDFVPSSNSFYNQQFLYKNSQKHYEEDENEKKCRAGRNQSGMLTHKLAETVLT